MQVVSTSKSSIEMQIGLKKTDPIWKEDVTHMKS